MKLSQLQKKVADVLGVSSSQKILAFEIFIDKISEILLEDITIKVPRIGFFQLKTVSVKNGNRPLIFSPLSEDFLKDARQLYLTIDVKAKSKNTAEFDSDIFSIGVGKPLLPLSVDESPDTETSYAMLKKSIEERVKELLTESDQIPNFNIWDDYYKSPSKYEDESGEETKKQLTELTSDLKFKQESLREKKDEKIPEHSDPSPEMIEPVVSDGVEPDLDFGDIIGDITKSSDAEINTELKRGHEDDRPEEFQSIKKEDGLDEDLISPVIDFSEIEKLRYDENPDEKITIAELLDDIPASKNKSEDSDEYVIGENTVPVKEALDRILADEKITGEKSEDENPANELLPPENISAFDELHHLNDEVLSSQELIGEIRNESHEENTGGGNEPADIQEEGEGTISIFDQLHKINDEVISSEEIYEELPAANEELSSSIDVPELPAAETQPEISESETQPEIPETETRLEIPEPEIPKAETQTEIVTAKVVTEKEEVPSVPEPENTFSTEQVSRWNENEEEAERQIESEDEKIEWNWGDELREEFGIPKVAGEDTKFEMVDEFEDAGGGLEITDDFLDDNTESKDFFDQLEKTLERELNLEDSPHRRFTNADKKSTIDRNNLKKVVLEFSGPPPKYEFIEDHSGAREKRMAITLVDEEDDNRYRKPSTADNTFGEKYKDNYFRKMAFIIFGSFIIVGSIVVFIILKGNSSKNPQNQSTAVQQSPANALPDSSLLASANQTAGTNNDTSANPYEINDFPRTAFPPVPIKDATDKQIVETIKREAANLKSAAKTKNASVVNPVTSKPVSTDKVKNPAAAETRVSDRVYFDGKNYNIQISSWPNRARAEEELSRLQKLGTNPIIVEANLPKKGGMWYRIRLGPFKTQKEAEDVLKKNNF